MGSCIFTAAVVQVHSIKSRVFSHYDLSFPSASNQPAIRRQLRILHEKIKCLLKQSSIAVDVFDLILK